MNTNLRVPLTAHRLTINFERNSQIVTLSETDVSATFTFAIYDTLVKQPAGPETIIMDPPLCHQSLVIF